MYLADELGLWIVGGHFESGLSTVVMSRELRARPSTLLRLVAIAILVCGIECRLTVRHRIRYRQDQQQLEPTATLEDDPRVASSAARFGSLKLAAEGTASLPEDVPTAEDTGCADEDGNGGFAADYPGRGGCGLRDANVTSETAPPQVEEVVPEPAEEEGGISSTLDRLAREAENIFGGSATEAPPGGSLPGYLTVERFSATVESTEDLRSYLFPRAVVVIDDSLPLPLSDTPALTASSFKLRSPWTGPSGSGLRGSRLDYLLLPGKFYPVDNGDSGTASEGMGAFLRRGSEILVGRQLRNFVPPPNVTDISDTLESTSSFSLERHMPDRDAAMGDNWFLREGAMLLPEARKAHPGAWDPDMSVLQLDWDPRSWFLPGDGIDLIPETVMQSTAIAWEKVYSVYVDPDTDSVLPNGLRLAFADTLPAGAPTDEPSWLVRTGKRRLPGGMSLTEGSNVGRTSESLQEYVEPGDVLEIGNFRPMVVGGGPPTDTQGGLRGDVRTAATADTVQFVRPHIGASADGLPVKHLGYRRMPCSVDVTQGDRTVRTRCDLSDHLGSTTAVRIQAYPQLDLAPPSVDPIHLTRGPDFVLLREPYPGTSEEDVSMYIHLRASGVPKSGGDEETLLAALLGTIHVIRGSSFGTTTEDLSARLSTGDWVEIGRTSTMVVAEPPTPTTVRFTTPWNHETNPSASLARRMRRVALSGMIHCTEGGTDAKTSVDLRHEIGVGDLVQLVPESRAAATSIDDEDMYVVVTPFDGDGFTLSESFRGSTNRQLRGFRVLSGGSAGVLLPGGISVTQGSPAMQTTEDLTAMLRSGDRIRVGLRDWEVREPVTASGFQVTQPYTGTTAHGLKAFHLGRSSHGASLEMLAVLKLRCRSIFCLAKIEELEQQLPSAWDRSLDGGEQALGADGLQGLGSRPSQNAGGVPSEAEAEKVETEWRQWFQHASSELSVRGAQEGAAQRVEDIHA